MSPSSVFSRGSDEPFLLYRRRIRCAVALDNGKRITVSSSIIFESRGHFVSISSQLGQHTCKTSPNRSFLFIISLHICEKYFISMGLRGHRSRFSRSVSTFFSPGKLAWYAEKIDSSSTCSNKNMWGAKLYPYFLMVLF